MNHPSPDAAAVEPRLTKHILEFLPVSSGHEMTPVLETAHLQAGMRDAQGFGHDL